MTKLQPRRIMGMSGVLIGVGITLVLPLYFLYSGPPPAWDVFTRELINLFVLVLFFIFFACFSHLIREADQASGWLASIVFGAGLLYVAIGLIATANETGVVYGSPGHLLDPTIDGPLADANILMHGSIKRLLTTVALLAGACAIKRTGILPSWAAMSAYTVALCNLLFVPALFFGHDVTRFYSAVGWGNSALVGSFFGYWTFATGFAALRPKSDAPIS